jgi:hypothetical protein
VDDFEGVFGPNDTYFDGYLELDVKFVRTSGRVG